MAVSNRKIGDSITFAKRLCFNHNPVIGNSLEPALTSANIGIQTFPLAFTQQQIAQATK